MTFVGCYFMLLPGSGQAGEKFQLDEEKFQVLNVVRLIRKHW